MSDTLALIRAVQDALTGTEIQAHRIINFSHRLLGSVHHDDLTSDETVRRDFRRMWSELCDSLRQFWSCYASRSSAGVFIPEPFRPHKFLSSVATTSESNGIIGHSRCEIAYKYGLRLRDEIRQTVPRGVTRAAQPSSESPALVVATTEVAPDSHGGFGFSIPDTAFPDLQVNLGSFPWWDSVTVEQVKIQVTQEVKKAWAQVPITISAMATPSPVLSVERSASPTSGQPANSDTPLECEYGLLANQLSVLLVVRDSHPVLLKNVEIETIANLSKQTVGEIVRDLIDRGLAARPYGRNKGTTATKEGIALVDRIRNSSTNHP